MGQWRRANTGLQRYPRIAMSVPVRISTVDPEVDPDTGKLFFRSVEETTANLSHGGAYLRSWEPLEAGRRVVVAIDLSSGEEVQLTGRVIWTRRELRPVRTRDIEATGYGIEFFGLSSRELASLDRLITEFDPKSPSQITPEAKESSAASTAPEQPAGNRAATTRP